MRSFQLTVFALLAGWLALAMPVRAGIAPFTDPGKIDFDAAMQLLNPYGSWAKVGDKWAFTPLDHATPYTNGRWLYSEYGWLWHGNSPTSWLTEHYGYWKRGSNKVWAWYPGAVWLPQIVEIRASPAGIGWRSGEVDPDGNFVEQPSDRFTKTDEWTFVTPHVFAGPITPAVIAKPAEAEKMLEESTESVHSYLTYREIDRPGPHPADFINLGDSLMFPPMTDAERTRALHPFVASSKSEPEPAKPAAPKPDAARIAASLTASDTMPEIPQQPGGDDPNDDPRQVKYWVTMALPTAWTQPPSDASLNQIFLYRPAFYQDDDGIARRIAFWLDPKLRSSESIHLADVLNQRPARASMPAGATAGIPAAPTADFSSPFEDNFHSSSAPAGASTKVRAAAVSAPSTRAPAPDGRAQP
jgi:hypothetical protein